MSDYKQSHLSLKCWTDYASGEVDGCFPNPVEADTIIDLAVFEASKHEADYVNLTLSNKFNSGYMSKDMTYKAATILSMNENEFNTCTGTMNQSIISNGKIHFRANRRYSYDEVFREEANSVSELILRLAARKVTGTLSINFLTYPNGHRCYPDVVKRFKLCL